MRMILKPIETALAAIHIGHRNKYGIFNNVYLQNYGLFIQVFALYMSLATVNLLSYLYLQNIQVAKT